MWKDSMVSQDQINMLSAGEECSEPRMYGKTVAYDASCRSGIGMAAAYNASGHRDHVNGIAAGAQISGLGKQAEFTLLNSGQKSTASLTPKGASRSPTSQAAICSIPQSV